MKLGFVSDSLGGMSFETMLDHAARMGVSGVEVNTCGWSTAPHFDLKGMLGNAAKQKAFKAAFAGTKRLYVAAGDAGGLSTGWVNAGSWTVN